MTTGGRLPSWIWLVGLLLIGAFLWKMFTRSRAASTGNYALPGMQSNGYGPVNPGAQYGTNGAPMAGPGNNGLLKMGLAVGAGVAGGMLLDEMLHRRGSEPNTNNFGGLDPNSYDPAADRAASDFENRSIDFGQGNDDWDAGSIDTGGDGGGSWD